MDGPFVGPFDKLRANGLWPCIDSDPMSDDTKRDYRDTVFLPKTDFPMKAGLPQKEPSILARWQEIGLYERLREQRRGRKKVILHDRSAEHTSELPSQIRTSY